MNRQLKQLFLNDKFILFLIIFNAILIFLDGFQQTEKTEKLFDVLDNLITVLFIVEIWIKISVLNKSYFKSNWNILDFSLVILSIPALLAFVFGLDFKDYSFLLVFRVMRVFKSFRFLKFIPGIEQLLEGVRRALKTSILVIVGFMIYVFVIGVFSFYLFRDLSPEYFENPFMALYSTFKIFTVEGWYEIPEDLSQNLSSTKTFFVYLYFIFVVLTGGILGLSLVNSIFIDAMVSDNTDELEEKVDNLEMKIDLLLKKNDIESPD